LAYFLPKTLKLFIIPFFWLWSYLMKVIPETCRAYDIHAFITITGSIILLVDYHSPVVSPA